MGSIALAQEIKPIEPPSYYATPLNNEELRISILTERIRDIKERLKSPSLQRSERQILQRELEALTSMLTNLLLNATGTKGEKSR